jgi:hypothetical protein
LEEGRLGMVKLMAGYPLFIAVQNYLFFDMSSSFAPLWIPAFAGMT